MFATGQGVPQDYGQAIGWYRKAADQGYAPAQFSLGVMFDSGQGVPQSSVQAVTWYRKAADQGHIDAQRDSACFALRGLEIKHVRLLKENPRPQYPCIGEATGFSSLL